jgi:hypothetical protein
MALPMWNTSRLALYGAAGGSLLAAYDLAGQWSFAPNSLADCAGGLFGGAVGGALLVAAAAGLRNLIVGRSRQASVLQYEADDPYRDEQ